MYPYIDLGFYLLPTFWVCNMCGVLVSGLMLFFRNRRFKLAQVDITNAVALGFCGAIVGAKALYTLTVIPVVIKNRAYFFQDIKSLFEALTSGAVFYGGLILFILTINWYLKRYKLDKNIFWDFAAPAIPLFHAFGRIGCFFNGCCHGIVSYKFGIAYTHSAASINGLPYLPVQLIESALNFVLFFVLIAFEHRHRGQGKTLYCYLMSYAVIRFVLEFFRGDIIRGIWGPFSTSQWIGLVILVYCAVHLIHENAKKSI
jgi:phosphatidylglycerol:prolipoprotein diacylglycerol transferase